MHRTGDFGIGGQQAEVGIDARCGCVVVSSPQMRIPARNAVGVTAREQGQFAMRLETHESVEHLNAGIL